MNPILALIIANVIWGAASPIFKFALLNIPPFTLAFSRFFLGSIILFIFLRNIALKNLTVKNWLALILGSFFGITVNIAFFFLGLQKTQSINAPIIASSAPVFLYFLSVFFLREKPKLKVFFGMVIGLIGVLTIILSPVLFDGKSLALGELEGNLFIVIATFGAVLHPILYKNILKKIDPYQITLFSFIVGAVSFFPLMLGELKNWSFASLNLNGLTGIIFGAFLSSVAAYCLFNYGLSKIDAEEVGLFTYVDPIVAVLIAMPLVHEYPNIYFLFGSLFVFGGIFIAEKRIHWHPLHKLRNHS